ncbi:MAG: hypothetical protein ACFE9N_13375 [Promethearchaeota archaeon]
MKILFGCVLTGINLIKIYKCVSLGAHTDSIPFHLRKFDSIDITTRAAANYAHSVEDTPDKVDPQILLETCRVIQLLLMMLDKNFKSFIKSD